MAHFLPNKLTNATKLEPLGVRQTCRAARDKFFRPDVAAKPIPAPRGRLGEIPEHGGSGTG
jgi:hypothetical protein